MLLQFARNLNNYIFLDINNILQNVKNRCVFDILYNGEITLQLSSCNSRNILITYLKHRLGEKCGSEEEFDNYVRDGFCCTLKKKLKELNRCLKRLLVENEN